MLERYTYLNIVHVKSPQDGTVHGYQLVERVIYKVNSFQFTRSARLVLALPE